VAPRRGFRGRAAGPKRQVTWIGPADQSFITVGSGLKVLIASFDPDAGGLTKSTVVRTRGEVSTALLTSPAADVTVNGAFGLGIVTAQALAIGITAIPGPFTDADWDGWFVWGSFGMRFDSITQAGVLLTSQFREVDSKAMRKIPDGSNIVLVAESQAGGFAINMPLRLLLKVA